MFLFGMHSIKNITQQIAINITPNFIVGLYAFASYEYEPFGPKKPILIILSPHIMP